MGMTIDEAIKRLNDLLPEKPYEFTDDENERKFEYAYRMAIDTMRKYQKIQEIINNTDYIEEDVIRYKMICEVVEDGNN